MAQFTVSCVEQNIWEVKVEAPDERMGSIPLQNVALPMSGVGLFIHRKDSGMRGLIVRSMPGYWCDCEASWRTSRE